ncbi:uncharacterized protein LODBEIA_P16770 [Lodderomyces beijingensis]|uniref:Kinetochore protein SPC25 n=1 Tax=Lodderomyces beijingensis TaxID=1775926 RepID=A0ABP0ZH09_9ASCO
MMETYTKAYDKFQTQLQNFETLKLEMEEFLSDLDHKLTAKQQLVTKQEQDYKTQVFELSNLQKDLKSQLSSLTSKGVSMSRRQTEEMANLSSLKTKIESLVNEQMQLLKTKAKVDDSVHQLQDQIAQSKLELDQSNDALKDQMRNNGLELSKCELYSGLIFTPVDASRIQFIFTCVDPEDWYREFRVVLNVLTPEEGEEQEKKEDGKEKDAESREEGSAWTTQIKVEQCEPELPQDFIDLELENLHKNGHWGRFLKAVRGKFTEIAAG